MARSCELKDDLGQETGANPTPTSPMIAEPEQPIGVTIKGFCSLGKKEVFGYPVCRGVFTSERMTGPLFQSVKDPPAFQIQSILS